MLDSLFNKVKETPTQVFSSEYCKISKNTYFEKHCELLLVYIENEVHSSVLLEVSFSVILWFLQVVLIISSNGNGSSNKVVLMVS